MIVYNWAIVTCEHEVATGGITVAHWRTDAVDGDFSASAYGTCSFSPDPESENFKPYDEVTEEEVLSWVWDSVGKDATEASLEEQIESQRTPKTSTGTPW
jgi:hypothetical protein